MSLVLYSTILLNILSHTLASRPRLIRQDICSQMFLAVTSSSLTTSYSQLPAHKLPIDLHTCPATVPSHSNSFLRYSHLPSATIVFSSLAYHRTKLPISTNSKQHAWHLIHKTASSPLFCMLLRQLCPFFFSKDSIMSVQYAIFIIVFMSVVFLLPDHIPLLTLWNWFISGILMT